MTTGQQPRRRHPATRAVTGTLIACLLLLGLGAVSPMARPADPAPKSLGEPAGPFLTQH